jgi:outer membrane protein W
VSLGCRKAIAEIKKMVVEGPSIDIDDAVGLTLQAGVDVSLGGGWYLNADVKKTWLDSEATWHNNAALEGADVKGDVDLDPWIFSAPWPAPRNDASF